MVRWSFVSLVWRSISWLEVVIMMYMVVFVYCRDFLVSLEFSDID